MSVIVLPGFAGKPDSPVLGWRRPSGTASANTQADGFEAGFAFDEDLINAWKPETLPGQLEYEFDTPQEISYVGIGAHTIGSSGASVRIDILVGSSWEALPGSEFGPEDDSAILYIFATREVEGVRVRVAGEVAEVGYVLAGMATNFPRRARYLGLPISESQQVEYRDNTSMTGKPLGRTLQRDGLDFTIEIENLPETFRVDEWREFREAMERGGRQFFFYAPKPESYPDDVALAWQRSATPFERDVPNRAISGAISMRCGGYRVP